MTCPLCNIALKAAGHRGVAVSYCPICGGTWLDQWTYDHLAVDGAPPPRARGRLLRITVITAVVLVGCLAVTLSVGAVKLWPTVRGWTEVLISGKNPQLAAELKQWTGGLVGPRLLELSKSGLSSAVVSALSGNAGFERLLNSVAAAPSLAPLVQSGDYLKALQEAARQNVPNLADLKIDRIVAPDVRAAAEQVQQALRAAPGGGGVAGIVDPAVLQVLGSEAFQQLSRSGLLEQFFDSARQNPPAD